MIYLSANHIKRADIFLSFWKARINQACTDGRNELRFREDDEGVSTELHKYQYNRLINEYIEKVQTVQVSVGAGDEIKEVPYVGNFHVSKKGFNDFNDIEQDRFFDQLLILRHLAEKGLNKNYYEIYSAEHDDEYFIWVDRELERMRKKIASIRTHSFYHGLCKYCANRQLCGFDPQVRAISSPKLVLQYFYNILARWYNLQIQNNPELAIRLNLPDKKRLYKSVQNARYEPKNFATVVLCWEGQMNLSKSFTRRELEFLFIGDAASWNRFFAD